MADKKTYYYLKLKEGFFDSEDMLLLQGMKDGYIYSDILLKLYLMSLRQDGRLMYRGIIPYTPDMVATITHHQVGTVEKAMKVLASMGFIEILDNGAIYMLDIQNFIGRSSNEADRKREYRATINAEKSRIIEDKEGQMSRQMSDVRAPENRDKRTDNKDNKDNKNISLELKGSKQNTFISLPLITGSGNYDVTFDYLNSLRELFPALDVEQEFRSMAAWLDSHPHGIPIFMKDSLIDIVGEKNMRRDFPEELKKKTISKKLRKEHCGYVQCAGRKGNSNISIRV